MTANAAWLEVAWAALNLLGAIASGWNARQTSIDRKAVLQAGVDGPLLEEANIARRSELIRFGELVAGLIAGTIACFEPPNPVRPVTAAGTAVVVFLFLMPIGLAGNSALAVRHRLDFSAAHRLRQREEATHGT